MARSVIRFKFFIIPAVSSAPFYHGGKSSLLKFLIFQVNEYSRNLGVFASISFYCLHYALKVVLEPFSISTLGFILSFKIIYYWTIYIHFQLSIARGLFFVKSNIDLMPFFFIRNGYMLRPPPLPAKKNAGCRKWMAESNLLEQNDIPLRNYRLLPKYISVHII